MKKICKRFFLYLGFCFALLFGGSCFVWAQAAGMDGIDLTPPMRIVQVDLDYVYDPDPGQMAHNVDLLTARIAAMKISAVFLQAFADPNGTGLAAELYFPNRQLPMRADLFDRVASQLKARAAVKIYGWLPVLSFDFQGLVTPVMAWNPDTGAVAVDSKGYKRASPFDPDARERITEIYEDMGRGGSLDGILFHDDAVLSDFEDASPPALKAYARAGFPASVEDIRADADLMAKWTDFKVEALISFTRDLAKRASLQSPLTTVRNIYALPVLNPGSREWFAQDYGRFLQAYDYTAVEAMPQMENIANGDAEEWMGKLVDAARGQPTGLSRTIFELQAVDWRKKDSDGESRIIPTPQLAAQMRFLARHGALNFGYYPDDFVANAPDADALHKDFSPENDR